MKKLLLLLTVSVWINSNAQELSFDSLMTKGKAEFKKEFEEQDFSAAVEFFERALELRPANAEAHYFLGYAYDRLNSKDGKTMTESRVSLSKKASEEFEKAIMLSPKYEGEKLILDPYSKISSIWGALAMGCWANNKPDSAKWALYEGKKRGGFGDYLLETTRLTLDICEPNAILISSGDNVTFPLLYLQLMENYRTDVAVIDVSLLNTFWYPQALVQNKIVQFDLPINEIDSIGYYKTWKDSTITINGFSWTMKPSYGEQYILRNDMVLLSLLRKNKFERSVYFAPFFNPNNQMSLGSHLVSYIMATKVNVKKEAKPKDKEILAMYEKALSMTKHLNANSEDEYRLFDSIRTMLLAEINTKINDGKTKAAQKLLEILDKHVDRDKYPYLNSKLNEFDRSIRERL